MFCVEMYAGNSHEEADPETGKSVTRYKGDIFWSLHDLATLHPEKFRLVQPETPIYGYDATLVEESPPSMTQAPVKKKIVKKHT